MGFHFPTIIFTSTRFKSKNRRTAVSLAPTTWWWKKSFFNERKN